ncbi:unnamed protein product [Coregonus sp. 'balchen']|nr:unnamed protein product [Coregonus sp. 'balchen']
MQLGRTRLSPQEHDRHMHEGCCLCCGGLGHLRATCPELTGNARAVQLLPSHPVTVCHYLQSSIGTTVSTTFKPLWTGASDHFMDQDFTSKLQIPCMKCPIPLQLQALDGRPISSGQVEYQTKPILLQVGLNHSETLSFLLITAPENPLILGYPWQVLHDPLFSWSTGHLLDWGKNCLTKCLRPPPRASPRSRVNRYGCPPMIFP